MKNVLIIGLILLLSSGAFAQSQLLISTAVAADATYTTHLLFAGIVVHASAANSSAIVYDGATEIFRWTEPTDKRSSGFIFPQGGIAASTNIRVVLVNCVATLYRRYY